MILWRHGNVKSALNHNKAQQNMKCISVFSKAIKMTAIGTNGLFYGSIKDHSDISISSYHPWMTSAKITIPWWRHQMETFSALLAICAGNSPVLAQRPVTRSFYVFFDLRLNKRFSKQSRGWWFETLSCPLWRHCNDRSSVEFAIYYTTEETLMVRPKRGAV